MIGGQKAHQGNREMWWSDEAAEALEKPTPSFFTDSIPFPVV